MEFFRHLQIESVFFINFFMFYVISKPAAIVYRTNNLFLTKLNFLQPFQNNNNSTENVQVLLHCCDHMSTLTVLWMCNSNYTAVTVPARQSAATVPARLQWCDRSSMVTIMYDNSDMTVPVRLQWCDRSSTVTVMWPFQYGNSDVTVPER